MNHLHSKVFLFLILVGLSFQNLYGAGVTTHWVIGEHAINHIKTKNDGLDSFLRDQYIIYRRGTVFPDGTQRYMQDNGIDASYGNDWLSHDGHSHKNKAGDVVFDQDNGNYMVAFAEEIFKNCGKPIDASRDSVLDGQCKAAYAYYFGIMNHLIGDSPWHNEFINDLTKRCVGSDIKNDYDAAHGFADKDIDICLSANLLVETLTIASGSPYKTPLVLPSDNIPTTKAEKTSTEITFGCASGQFLDYQNGGECWSCPIDDGFQRGEVNLYPVTSDKACYKPAYDSFIKAKKTRQNTRPLQGCPTGETWDIVGGNNALGACYTCEYKDYKGYSRTASAIDSDKACKRHYKTAYSPATKERAAYGCSSGKFLAVECIDTTDSVIKRLQGITIAPAISLYTLNSAFCGKDKVINPDIQYCHACPEEYPVHKPQYSAFSSKVCEKKKWINCGAIQLNSKMPFLVSDNGLKQTGSSLVTPLMLNDPKVQSNLKEGPIKWMVDVQTKLGRDKTKKKPLDWVAAEATINTFYETAAKEPLASFSHEFTGEYAWTENAAMCDEGFAQAFSGRGAIDDSAELVARFMSKAWDTFMEGKVPHLLRTKAMAYTLEVDGKEQVSYKY